MSTPSIQNCRQQLKELQHQVRDKTEIDNTKKGGEDSPVDVQSARRPRKLWAYVVPKSELTPSVYRNISEKMTENVEKTEKGRINSQIRRKKLPKQEKENLQIGRKKKERKKEKGIRP